MKKLTHCCTNVPYQDDGLCAYSLKAVPSRPTIIHSLHCASSTGEYAMAVIRDIDRTGRQQIALPHAFYFLRFPP
ncbi:MAG: hypothetical protein OJF51_003808 [Nitrospira sp.]|jgi:hypothetical protein|nr:MAG: hypothetical protein OJF51_003808 [Nitrospira sp.]